MSIRFFVHLVFLFLAVVTTWAWTSHPALSFYNLQLVAALIVVWFLKNRLWPTTKIPDALILAIIVFLLVFSTGGAGSPLFFLIYFLLFGLSFLFEPPTTITLAFILLVFLAPTVKTINEVASLLSLFLITPLALVFGRIYLKNLAGQKKIKLYQKKWLENEEHLEKQETHALLWLTTVLKPALIETLDKLSLLLSDLAHLTPDQKTNLKRIRKLAKRLLRGGEKLTRLIDRETDE